MDEPRRAGTLLGQVNAFRYATVPNAPTYRAVMQVCYDAMRRYVIELRPQGLIGRELVRITTAPGSSRLLGTFRPRSAWPSYPPGDHEAGGVPDPRQLAT